MLSNKDLHEEIETIDKLAKEIKSPLDKAFLKIGTLALKLLHNIRTNQTAIMEVLNAKKIKPQVREGEEGKSNVQE